MTKSSHKKKPTGAKLPRAEIVRLWLDNPMPHCAVLRMPTLKAAKQAVRFANKHGPEKLASLVERVTQLEGAITEYLRIHDSKGGEDYDGSIRPMRLALMGHAP